MESFTVCHFVEVPVNYSWSLKKMIRQGHYEWVDPDITEKNFPVNRRENGLVNVLLIKFHTINGESLYNTQKALRALAQLKMRPAELPELLAFGAKYPDEQIKSPIHGLGSIHQGLAPCLDNNVENLDGRGVILEITEKRLVHHDWCRFAAVKN